MKEIVKRIDYNWGQYAAGAHCNEIQEASTGCEGFYEVGKHGVKKITLTTDRKEASIYFEDKIIVQRNINRIEYRLTPQATEENEDENI